MDKKAVEAMWDEFKTILQAERIDDVYEKFEILLTYFEEIGDFQRYGLAYTYLCDFLGIDGQYNQLMYYGIRLSEKAKVHPEIKQYPEYYMLLATIDFYVGNYSSSIKYLEEARSIYNTVGDKRGIIRSIGNKAEIYIIMKEYHKAITSLLDAKVLLINTNEGNSFSGIYNKSVLAKVYCLIGDYDKGQLYNDELNSWSRLKDLPQIEYEVHVNYGRIFLGRKRREQAISHFRKAYDISKLNNFDLEVEPIWQLLARLYFENHQVEKALEVLEALDERMKKDMLKYKQQHRSYYNLLSKTLEYEDEIRKIRLLKRETYA